MKKAAPKKKKSVPGTVSTQLRAIDAKLDRVIDTMVTQHEFNLFKKEVSERFERIERNIEQLTIAVDKLTKSVESIMLEYAVIQTQLERYDRWFKEIAKKVGIELKP